MAMVMESHEALITRRRMYLIDRETYGTVFALHGPDGALLAEDIESLDEIRRIARARGVEPVASWETM